MKRSHLHRWCSTVVCGVSEGVRGWIEDGGGSDGDYELSDDRTG